MPGFELVIWTVVSVAGAHERPISIVTEVFRLTETGMTIVGFGVHPVLPADADPGFTPIKATFALA